MIKCFLFILFYSYGSPTILEAQVRGLLPIERAAVGIVVVHLLRHANCRCHDAIAAQVVLHVEVVRRRVGGVDARASLRVRHVAAVGGADGRKDIVLCTLPKQ